MEKRRELLFVLSISTILVLAGFAANEKAYAGGGPISFIFGDFKCWEFTQGTTVPPALFEIRDQFNPEVPITNEIWEQAAYCTAASKETFVGIFNSPFEPLFDQHYQAWFYPPNILNDGTGTTVILDVPQFDHQFTTVLGPLDSIMVPATKILDSGPVDSQDNEQHWNCYLIEEEPSIDVSMTLRTQHGFQEATVLDPFLLCAPMEKFDPFEQQSFGTFELDEHMVCYDLQTTPVQSPLPIALFDQLTSSPLPIFIGAQETFCAPAFKSFPVVGGFNVPIDNSALLLAGVSSISMWMIPVVIAGVGIGVFVIKRRN